MNNDTTFDILTRASDDHLADPLRRAVIAYVGRPRMGVFVRTSESDREFLHGVRDWAVHTGGASILTMTVLNAFLGPERNFPPPVMEYDAWCAAWGVA